MNYVYVLDYSDNTISEVEIPEALDIKTYLTEIGFDLDYCSYLINERYKLDLKVVEYE